MAPASFGESKDDAPQEGKIGIRALYLHFYLLSAMLPIGLTTGT